MQAIGVYGEQVGLSFQIVDDILDVEGASAELGKTAGKDAAARKATYVALLGVERSRRLALDCTSRALAALREVRVAGYLPPLAEWIRTRQN
jgi:geranylgeranyl pyrophosphate synthase